MEDDEFPPLTREEKERMVIYLYGKNKTIREIAKVVHMSFSDIGRILRQEQGYVIEPKKETLQVSKESEAFSLFRKGKSLIEVKIELDISSNDVLEYHKKYRELENADGYNRGYNAVQGNIVPYLQLFNLMNQLGMTPEQVAEQVKYGNNLSQLRSIHTKLSGQIHALESKHWELNSELELIANNLQLSKHWLEFYNNEYVRKNNELKMLVSEINTKKYFIEYFDTDKGYIRIKKAAAEQTKLLLQDNHVQLAITLSATLEAIRKYPDNQALIFELLRSKDYSRESFQLSLMHSHGPQLLRLAEHIHDKMTEEITMMAISAAKLIHSNPGIKL
jgi:hypothetical protein